METGPWNWRKFLLKDGEGVGGSSLSILLDSLATTGEEFSLTCYRPSLSQGPAEWRTMLVTWGEYLDMTVEEITDKMYDVYGWVSARAGNAELRVPGAEPAGEEGLVGGPE